MLTKSQKRKRRKALKKQLDSNLGSIEKREDAENPHSVGTSATVDNKTSMSSPAGTTNFNGNAEVQKKMETSSGTNATANTILKKIKRENLKSNDSDSGDNLSTHESTQEGLSTAEVLEVKGDETVSAITATIDAKVVSKEDHSEVAKGETGESETTNLNVSGKEKRKRKKSKNKQSTLGDILDPLYLEAAKHDNLVSNEQKRQKINDNSALGDILSTCENTSKVLQAVSADVIQGEEHMKDANANDVGKEETGAKAPEKKHIILDVNGLLADVVSDLPDDIIADKYIARRASTTWDNNLNVSLLQITVNSCLTSFVCLQFSRDHMCMNFCLFVLRDSMLAFGLQDSCIVHLFFLIYSCFPLFCTHALCICRRNLVPVVDFLLGDLKKQLLFLWDGCKCTDSGIGTLDVQYKNIVVKDLRKIWDEDGPGKSWVKGTFTESNTLLVDDSPYKGLLNPKYTGIFPAAYSYMHSDDNLLGPKGELQTFLEGLAAVNDVRTYVAQHPFGQGAIDEQNPHWEFYSSFLERLNDETLMKRLLKKTRWKRKKCCHGNQKRKRLPGKGQRW
ncbi:uncharacterized protein LOC143593539 [Bidens hawaiensis]|uniref:uncharacterized protein LOC143593539 n=1 Tax=Bidens hawaiensis TaxID=980011 RepID=UPI00404B7180